MTCGIREDVWRERAERTCGMHERGRKERTNRTKIDSPVPLMPLMMQRKVVGPSMMVVIDTHVNVMLCKEEDVWHAKRRCPCGTRGSASLGQWVPMIEI